MAQMQPFWNCYVASSRRMYLKGETCSWTPAQAHLEVMSSFSDTCTKSEVEGVAKYFRVENKTTRPAGLTLPENFVRKSI